MIYRALSECGLRSNNEDAYLIPESIHDTPIAAVSDGMGGCACGEIASSMVISMLRDADPAAYSETGSFFTTLINQINVSVYRTAQADPSKGGMGATLVCAYLRNEGVTVANIGDSRLYLIHDGSIQQITHDHSYVNMLLEKGLITSEQAKNHPRRNIITKAIGVELFAHPDIFEISWQQGDILLLCSDGLSGVLSDADLLSVISASSSPDDICPALVSRALSCGSRDNITCVICINDAGGAK